MSRRIWFVLSIVVAVLVIAPNLPRWWPAAVTAVSQFDYAALGRNIISGAQQALELAVTHPQLVGGVAGGFLLVMIGAVVIKGRALRARAVTTQGAAPRARPITATEPVTAALTPAIAPVSTELRPPKFNGTPIQAPIVASAPAPKVIGTRAPRLVGRGTTVRRLSLAGHSTAEIARATRVGQDAVRLVVSRQKSS